MIFTVKVICLLNTTSSKELSLIWVLHCDDAKKQRNPDSVFMWQFRQPSHLSREESTGKTRTAAPVEGPVQESSLYRSSGSYLQHTQVMLSNSLQSHRQPLRKLVRSGSCSVVVMNFQAKTTCGPKNYLTTFYRDSVWRTPSKQLSSMHSQLDKFLSVIPSNRVQGLSSAVNSN